MRSGLLALSIAVLACNTAASVAEPWQIELASDGGFTGRGIGTIAADSEHATAALRRAVAASKPQHWEREYAQKDAPHGYTDEIHFTLTLRSGDHEYVTSWYQTAPLPRDLEAISDALRSAK